VSLAKLVAVLVILVSLALLPVNLGHGTTSSTVHITPVAASKALPSATALPRMAGVKSTPFISKFVPKRAGEDRGAGYQTDPYDYYDSEPAPMGIADYGVTSAGAGAYSYATSAVRGTVTLEGNPVVANASLGANSPLFGIQLNVMMIFDDSGGNQYTYWVQDVAVYNTSDDQMLTFVDNIWNDSSSGSQMYSTSVTGNGTISSSGEGNFYNDEASGSLPGAEDSPLSAPGSFTLEMDAFETDTGVPGLAFLYSDGYGPIAYDVAEFPFAAGSEADYGFVVDGEMTTPIGEPYDLELTFGGPGGGSQTTDELSDLLFELWYFNGYNFQTPQNAFNFGSETAEGSGSVADYGVYLIRDGNMSALLVNGTVSNSVLGMLYNYTIVSDLNFTDGTASGTITINGVPTLFSGGVANLTLYPGSYYVNVTIGASTTPLGVCDLTAETELYVSLASPCSGTPPPPLEITSFTASSTSPTVGQTVTFTVVTTGGGGTLSYAYSGLPAGCTSSDEASLACVPTTAGSYTVTVWVNTTDGQSDSQALDVTVAAAPPAPSITSVTLSSNSVQIGQTITFTVVVSGGTPPFTYLYQNLPTGCTSANTATLTCTPQVAGSFTVSVTVTDSLGKVATDTFTFDVTSSSGLSGSFAGLSDYIWIALVGLVVVIVVVLVVLRSRSRSRPSGGYPPSGYPPAGYPPSSGPNAPPAGYTAAPPSNAPPAAWNQPPPQYSSPPQTWAPAPAAPPAAPPQNPAWYPPAQQPMYSPPPTAGAPYVAHPPMPQPKSCPRCGALNAPGMVQCGRCGAYLPPG
jgi:hypothetical protein